MTKNPYANYQTNKILTASPQALTLMLYDGAIKFGNLAKEGMIEKNANKINTNVKKVQNITNELLTTLNFNYPIAKEFQKLYLYITNLLTTANVTRNANDMEKVIEQYRGLRELWQEICKNKTNLKIS